MNQTARQNRCYPVEVKRITPDKAAGKVLIISWSDGIDTSFSAGLLRNNCPCASCVEERGESNHNTPLTPATSSVTGRARLSIAPEVSGDKNILDSIKPVGNYAINLSWQDGHHTGIYSWELLRNLGTQTQP